MLTKRTNILFDEATWKLLAEKSKSRGVSVGELVRQAILKQYADVDLNEERKQAFEGIVRIRTISKGKTDYKELINYGRKY